MTQLEDKESIDGRRRRRTGRTEQFATRVSHEFKMLLDEVAEEAGMMYVEVLEEALRDFKRKIDRNKKRSNA
jgi:hypothetical protein